MAGVGADADAEAEAEVAAAAEASDGAARVRRSAVWRELAAGAVRRRSPAAERTELTAMHAASEQQLELLARAIEEYKRRRLANKGNLRY